MKQVHVVGTGAYLPGEPLNNADLERLVGPLPEDILAGIQVEQRYWMVNPATGEHCESNSDMAYKATKQALDLAAIAPEEVDLLIVSTGSPDYPLPPTVTLLQDKLGLRRCATIEIRSGCAGTMEALEVARLYLERGLYRTAVIVGSEAISPLLVPIYLGKDPATIRMRDRLGLYSFGDGAGALVLQVGDEGTHANRSIYGSAIACVGGGKQPGMQIIGGGTHAPLHEQIKARRLVDLRVDVVASSRFTPYVLTEALTDLLQRSGVSVEEIDVCVLPEGNAGYMTDELRVAGLLTREWLALEDKIVENLSLVGATGSAAVPIALDYGWKTGRIKRGDLVMLLAIETSKWKYGGMVLPWTADSYQGASAGTCFSQVSV